jgi:hypothetical protein
MIAQSRVRYFTQRPNGNVDDTGWELVQYPGHGEMWEPADTVLARGANGPTKSLTGVRTVTESGNGLAPFNSNVFYPRTGTAAA